MGKTYIPRGQQQANIADASAITENSTTIAGTNDGNFASLTSTVALGAGMTTTTLTAAVNSMITNQLNYREGIRECATAINTLTTKLNSVFDALEAFDLQAPS